MIIRSAPAKDVLENASLSRENIPLFFPSFDRSIWPLRERGGGGVGWTERNERKRREKGEKKLERIGPWGGGCLIYRPVAFRAARGGAIARCATSRSNFDQGV